MAMRRRKTIEFIFIGALLAAAGLASATETITYAYDAKGRLIRVTHSGSVNNNVVVNYAFDAADNRRNVATTGAP